MTTFKYILICLGVLTLLSCREDLVQTGSIDHIPEPEVLVETEVRGLVTDRQGQAIAGAVVRMAGDEAETDVRGYFRVAGIVPRGRAILHIRKDGYFEHTPVFHPTESSSSLVRVALIEKGVATNFDASSGGEVAANEGIRITFPANGIVDELGASYTGTVHVHTAYIDPSDPELDSYMPGDLSAIDQNAEERVLRSFGMAHVELTDDSGANLQLSKPATLEIPIPNDRLADAPNEIPLWYFDISTGYWQEEGTATLQGSIYVGEVSHFSLWNCDEPFPLVEIGTRVISNLPYSDLKVCITHISTGDRRCVIPNDLGFFFGKVPANEDLLIQVFDVCGEELFAGMFGPYSSTPDLAPITANGNAAAVVSVSGMLVDCDMNVVSDGYVLIQGDGIQPAVIPVVDGSFTGEFHNCTATEITIVGGDVNGMTIGDAMTFPIQGDVSTGTLSACGQNIVESVTIVAPGLTKVIPNCVIQATQAVTGDTLYTFTSIDDLGNGAKVIYNIDIFNWLPGEPDPLYAITIGVQWVGPEPHVAYFTSACMDTEQVIIQTIDNQDVGQFIQFVITTDILENVNGMEAQCYGNGTFTITGRIIE